LIKDELKKSLLSRRDLVPKLRAFKNFFSLVTKYHISNDKILSYLDKVSYKDFVNYFKTLWRKIHLTSFLHGDISKGETRLLHRKVIENRFSGIKILRNVINYHTDLSGYFIFRERQNKSFNLNHAILNFYQIGKYNIKAFFISSLIKSLVGYIYFTQLRIKEQLGYTTKGRVFSRGNVLVNI